MGCATVQTRYTLSSLGDPASVGFFFLAKIMRILQAAATALLWTAVAGWGLCNDKNQHCGAWAKEGECEGKNTAYMQKTCPHSCSMCHHICRDQEDACQAWAKDGHCDSNPTYMLKTCPTSCGICNEKCYDKDPEDRCGEWARNGECTKNPSILPNCPVSCGVCTNLCLDKHNDCPQWAAAGDCQKNRAYMIKVHRSAPLPDASGSGIISSSHHRGRLSVAGMPSELHRMRRVANCQV